MCFAPGSIIVAEPLFSSRNVAHLCQILCSFCAVFVLDLLFLGKLSCIRYHPDRRYRGWNVDCSFSVWSYCSTAELNDTLQLPLFKKKKLFFQIKWFDIWKKCIIKIENRFSDVLLANAAARWCLRSLQNILTSFLLLQFKL